MEISIPNEITVLGSNLNPTEYPPFNSNMCGPYNVGDLFSFEEKVVEVNSLPSDTNQVPVYDASNTSYKVGDAVCVSGTMNVITSAADEDDLLQPEAYACKSTGANKSAWNCRYTNLGFWNGSSWSQTFGVSPNRTRLTLSGSTFTMEKESRVEQWSYFQFNSQSGSSTETWARSFNCLTTLANCYNQSDVFSIMYNGREVYRVSSAILPGNGEIFQGNDGKQYKIGARMNNQQTSDYLLSDYEIAQGTTSITWTPLTTSATIVYNIDGQTLEQGPIPDGSGPYDWRGKFFVVRGSTLYMRTTASQDYEKASSSVYGLEPVQSPSQLDFFSYGGVVDTLVPFDGKNYTFVEQIGPLTYSLTVLDKEFDTVALAGVLAETMDIIFKRADGTVVKEILNYAPDTQIDKYYRAGVYPTTEVFTSEILMEPNDIVTITLHGAIVRVATIMLGTKVDAGFSNVAFTNKYIDYSPFEKDQWGNILYIEGVKINTYSGTVDVPITDYDLMNRLFMSLGGKTIIVNGSDSNTTRSEISNSVYASTRLIGRVREFSLSTALTNKRIDETAVYNFKIEADV